MASNMDTDISLVAGLDESYSEAEILKVIKILEKRLRANRDGRIKLIAEIDETVIRDTVNKLQTILKSKDLKIDTKESIQAITKEVNAMDDVATMAKKAAVEKLEFEKANRKVKDSADDSTDAINRERSAIESMGSVDDILNGLSGSGRRCASVFQNMGSAFRDAFSVYGTVNLLEKSVEKLGEAGREALEIVKQYDDINIDLQLATGEDKGYVKGLISDYAELGNELGALTQDVAESADSFLRQGRSIKDTNKLIEDSVVLSKVAKTSGENASEILTATINGFQMATSEGSKVNDVLSSIDLHSASDASGIGDALTKVASMANNAGVSLEKTAAMIATIKDVTQDADTTIGTSLKTVLSRMNSIKAGKFIDEESGEALNDVEKILSAIGFSMRDVNGQFKEAEEIIDEVGKKWKTLDSNTQKAVTTAMGGTYQANKLVALFDNYDKVLELTNIAENSQGQALEKFNNSYLPSLEAKTQALQNSLEQLATTTFDDTLLASLLDVSKGMVDLITDTGILRGALIGLGTGGTLYVFSQLAGFLGEATQEFSNLNEAMNMTRSGTVAMGDMQRLIDLTGGLSQSQMRLVLSTQNLDDVQRIAILTQHNLSQGMGRELAEATARATLNTWGLTTAQQGMTTATVTLTNVIRGMYHALIANPIALITIAVTAGATAFHKLKQAQEEVIQSAREASNVYQDNVKSVEDYTARYTELRTALLEAKGNEEETYAVKEKLLALQTELNDKFADEYGAINLVTDAYKDQTEEIKNYNKEVANSFLNEERKGIDRATKQMTKDRNYVLSMPDISLETPEGKELKEIVDSYIKEGMYLVESTTGTVQIHLETDAQNAYDTINAFENDIREKAKELGDEHLFDSILDTSSISLNEAKETIDEFGDIFKQALMAEMVVDDGKATVYNEALNAVKEYNKAVLSSEDPYSDEKVASAKKNLDEVKAKIAENEAEWGKYSAVIDEVFAQADIRLLDFNQELQNNKELLADAKSLEGLSDVEVKSFNPGENKAYDRLKESAESYNVSVEEVIDSLIRLGIVQGEIKNSEPEVTTVTWDASSFNSTIQSYEDGYKRLTEAQEEWNEAKSISAETFAELQESGLLEYLDFTSEGLIINKDKLLENAQASKDKAVADLHAAMMSDMLQIALNNVDSVSEQAKTVIAQLGDNTEIAGNQALSSVGNWATLGAVITDTMARARGEDRGFNGVSDEQKAQMESVYNYYTDMAEKVSAIEITTPTRKASASKAGKSAADAYIKSFEDELQNLQDLRDRGKISEATYLEHLRMLYMKYFADRKEYLDEFKKYEAEYLSGLKSLYGSALSGITDALDKQISLYQKQKDVAIDTIESERDARKEALEEQKEQIELQIKNIDKQIAAKNKQIKAIQAESREIGLQADLQKAQYEAEQLRNNRTILQYSAEKGFHYTIDENALREKEREVDEKKDEIKINNIEKEIDLLEERKSMLEEQSSLIDEQISKVDEMYSKMIESTEKYWDSLIESMTNYKSRYEQLAELEATAKMSNDFKQLGIDIEAVLNMSEAEFQKFSNDYVGILADFYNGNEGMTNSLAETLGISASQLGSYVNDIQTFAKETTDALSPLAENTTGIDATTESVGKLSDAVNNGNVAEKLTSISDSINGIDSTKISSTTTEFSNLADVIERIATALGISTEDSVGGLLGALTSLSTISLGDEGTSIIAQFNALKIAVDDVTSAISGGGSKANESGGLATGANGGSVTPNMSGDGASGLIGSIDKLQQNTDKALGSGTSNEGEGTGIIGKFSALKTAIDDVTDAIGTTEDNSLDKGASNLISAIQLESKVVGDELPNQISLFQELLGKINECVASLGNMATAIQGASGSLSGLSFGGQTPQFLAKGTNHAKEGLTVVGEEAPELIEHNNGNLSLVTEPTLVNMEGGEKVYNGEETKSLLNPKQKQMLQDFMKHGLVRDDVIVKVNDDESPLLKARNLNLVQNAWSMQMQDLLSSPKPVQTVNNRTQTIEQHNQFNVTLPNINDSSKAVQLANELKRLPLQTMQYAHRR